MTTFLQFAVLGIGAGGAYAIAGIGLTQVYRGSGVLNLAHGAMAYVAAALFLWLGHDHGWSWQIAGVVAVAAAAMVGALVELLVISPLHTAAPLVQMTSTLGVLAIIQQGVPLLLGADISQIPVRSFYPQGAWRAGAITVGYDRLIVAAITVAIGGVLGVVMHRSRYGLATIAVAESRVIAATFGVPPRRVALTNWVLGAALAGGAGVLLLPIVGSANPAPLVFLVIPALAAAMIGNFRSFPLTVIGGFLLGAGQSLLTRYQADIMPADLAAGWPNALPFLVVVALLVVRGSAFPTRADVAARLPGIGRRRLPLAIAGPVVAAGTALTLITGPDLAGRITTAAGLALVGLSLVVVTGLAGQTSLAQMALAGVGALVAARLSEAFDLPFLLLIPIAAVAGSVVGALVSFPALRTRGPTLAISTLGVGIAIENVVLNNGAITLGGLNGTPIQAPDLFGLDIGAVQHPSRYAAMAVALLGIVAYGVATLRSGRIGRRLMALRSSERAASSIGFSLFGSKVAVFALGAAIAAVGGVVLSFRGANVTYSQFGLLPSLNLVVFTLIGGVGHVLGPVVGGLVAPGGVISYLFADLDTVERWIILTSGFALIVTLIANPDGIVGGLGRGRSRRATASSAGSEPELRADRKHSGAVLHVDGLTVRYRAVQAVSDVSITVGAGEIVGLVGPNGAGKTTFIDAVSGYTRAATGRISVCGTELNGRPAHRRAAAGLARTFQTVELFDDLDAAENIAVAGEVVPWWHWLTELVVPSPARLRPSLAASAAELDIDLCALPRELPQGRRRVLGVLRALATDPAILLLDEPAAGLDERETDSLAQLLRAECARSGLGVLLVDHDMELISAVCDRVVALDFGQTVFEGTPAQMREDHRVRSAYLGEVTDTERDTDRSDTHPGADSAAVGAQKLEVPT